MKFKLLVLPLLMASLLTGCGNNPEPSSQASSQEPSSEPSSTDPRQDVTFTSYTLADIHTAKVNNTLATFDHKGMIVKGKVTFVKEHADILYLAIQSGKDAVEIAASEITGTYNVGDCVEVYGVGADNGNSFDIGVHAGQYKGVKITTINEAIAIEDVKDVTTMAQLASYDYSSFDLTLTVVEKPEGARQSTSVAFYGKIGDSQEVLTVAKSLLTEQITFTPNVGDQIRCHGVFNNTILDSTNLVRFLDSSYIIPANK